MVASNPDTDTTDTALRHNAKYANTHWLHRWSLNRFFSAAAMLLAGHRYRNVLELGCGEGHFLEWISAHGVVFDQISGLDIREDAIQAARERIPQGTFAVADLTRPIAITERFDLVIASQVLEHLTDFEKLLQQMVSLTDGHILLTVPHEPWFQIMNLARGRDIRRLGNHPEHINRWGFREFIKVCAPYITVRQAVTSFPFTLVMGKPRH